MSSHFVPIKLPRDNVQNFSIQQPVPSIEKIISRGSKVVDCGCYGWRLADSCRDAGALLTGVDQAEPPGRPNGAQFTVMKDGRIDLPDGFADVTVASHILEHVIEPVKFFWELMRITRPGGMVWVEAPSELSVRSSSDNAEDGSFESFWDDPTHIRPWTPGAMYRLALGCHCAPIAISRHNSGSIPCTRMLGQKPLHTRDATEPRYVSLLNVDLGVKNAWAHVWGASDIFS